MKMASRMNVPRLALVAALTALLSGCYAHGGGRYTAHYGGGYAYGGTYHAPPGHAYHKHRHHKPGLYKQERQHRSAARARDHRPEPTRRVESRHRLERSGQPRHEWNAQAPRQNRPQVQRRRNASAETPRQNRPQVQRRRNASAETPRQNGPQVPRRRDPGAQAPRRNERGSADRKGEPQPAPAEGYGRRDEWRPGPTASDEGPRPGAEGGAR